MVLTDNEWKLYEMKYGKLMHSISSRITGDEAICSHEDNYAELCIEALKSITGFKKKTGQDFKDAFGTILFDKYTKTCLWNYKNNKGAKVTKKRGITQGVSISEYEEVLRIPDNSSPETLYDAEDLLTVDQGLMVDIIVGDNTVITEKGKLCISALSRKLGWTPYKTSRAVKELSRVLKNEL